jgi:hypothetical protein
MEKRQLAAGKKNFLGSWRQVRKIFSLAGVVHGIGGFFFQGFSICQRQVQSPPSSAVKETNQVP